MREVQEPLFSEKGQNTWPQVSLAARPDHFSTDQTESEVSRSTSRGVSDRSNRKRRLCILTMGTTAMAVLAIWAAVAVPYRTVSAGGPNDTRTAAVEQSNFSRTLRLHGLVEAVQSHTVVAPRLTGPGLNTLIITRILSSGVRVKKGELLVEFDRQNQIKTSLDRQAEFRDLEEQIKKKTAEQSVIRAHDETELKLAESAVGTAGLEMLKNEIISRIDAEKNRQNLQEAQAKLNQLRDTFSLKRQAATAEIRILEIQRDRARNAMRYAEGNAARMAIRSPLDGLVVLNPIWKSGQRAEVQEGDEVRPGVPFMQVVDPAAMRVRVRINQVDLPLIRNGTRARIGLDAYPDLVFSGRLDQVATIGVTSGLSNKVRTFLALFSISGSDPRLTPDLSAAVDVELERLEGVLVVSREAVRKEGVDFYVEVQRGTGTERRRIKTRTMNDSVVVIESGLQTGEIVIRQKAE